MTWGLVDSILQSNCSTESPLGYPKLNTLGHAGGKEKGAGGRCKQVQAPWRLRRRGKQTPAGAAWSWRQALSPRVLTSADFGSLQYLLL